MNCKALSLKEIVSEIIDYRGKTPKKLGADWSDTGYRALSAKNIKTGEIVQEDTIRFVDDDLYHKWMKQEVDRGTILITSEAPFGQVLYWNSDEKIVLSQRIFGLKIKSEFDSKYIYYYMTSSNYQYELSGRATGSTVTGLRQPELLKTTIRCPDIYQQKKISKILSNIDAKIECNNRTNDNLSLLCKQVFDGKILNYTGEKAILTFDDLVDSINGYSYSGTELSGSSKIGMATIKNFERSGGFKADGFKSIKPSNAKENNYVDVGDLLIACTDLTQNADIIGNTIMIFNKGSYTKLIASMDLLKIIPKTKKYSKDFLYELFNTAVFKNYAVGCTGGTTVLHLNKKALRKFQIALPKDAEYVRTIADQLASCHRIIGKNIIENENLTKLRDTLLPELLNGKIDVSNIDI